MKKYQIIYADPPWSYKDRNCNGAAAQHYKTMNLDDIKNLPIGELADKDCVLLLWACWPLLPEALEVIKAWGFTYKTIGFNWIKRNRGGGADSSSDLGVGQEETPSHAFWRFVVNRSVSETP